MSYIIELFLYLTDFITKLFYKSFPNGKARGITKIFYKNFGNQKSDHRIMGIFLYLIFLGSIIYIFLVIYKYFINS